MSCGVGCRRGSDPALLWLWRRPVATAPIQPLAWEPPYAAGAAQEIATTTTTTITTTTTTTTKDKKIYIYKKDFRQIGKSGYLIYIFKKLGPILVSYPSVTPRLFNVQTFSTELFPR